MITLIIIGKFYKIRINLVKIFRDMCLQKFLPRLNVIYLFFKYMQTFNGLVANSRQPVISQSDIDTIFFKIPDLHKIHSEFLQLLKPKVDQWSAEQEIAEPFNNLVRLPPGDYL